MYYLTTNFIAPSVLDVFMDGICYERPVIQRTKVVVHKTVHIHKHYHRRKNKRRYNHW